jgi:hypothetical protein
MPKIPSLTAQPLPATQFPKRANRSFTHKIPFFEKRLNLSRQKPAFVYHTSFTKAIEVILFRIGSGS